jgi:hypothetical protein
MVDLVWIALTIMAAVAWIGGVWSGILMLVKQRDSGRLYWLINPLAQLESTFTKECGVMVACGLIGIAAVMLRDALH